MNLKRFGIAAATVCLLAGSTGGVAAQDADGPTEYQSWRTKEVAPGVLRILDDDAGHDLARKWPKGQGGHSHIAVGPDGDVWLSVMIRVKRDDGRQRNVSRLWPLGREKTYGRADGLGEYHGSLAFDDDGRLWLFGSRVAIFEDGEWSSTKASNSVVAPEGSVWLGGGIGVEQWDGTELIPHLEGIWTGNVFLGADDIIGVEAWDGMRLFDGTEWQVVSRRGSNRAISEDGVLAVRTDNGKGIRLHRDGQEATVLDRMRVNSVSAAPDGSFWVAGSVGNKRGALYRVEPTAVFAAQVAVENETAEAEAAEEASST